MRPCHIGVCGQCVQCRDEWAARMDDGLFRKEALEGQRQRLVGPVLTATPLSVRVFAVAAVAIIAALGLVAALGQYSNRVSAIGWVVPADGIVHTRSPANGTVMSVGAAVGGRYDAGMEVLRLRVEDSLAAQDEPSEPIFAEKLETLTMRAAAESGRIGEEIAAIAHQIEALSSDVHYVEQRIGIQRARVALAQSEIERLEPIAAQGYLPTRELDRRRSALLELQSGLAALQAEGSASRIRRRELESRIQALQRAKDVVAADERLAASDIESARARARAARERSVLVPNAGTLAAMYVRAGDSVSAGQRLFAVSQDGGDASLVAEVFVPAETAAQVRVGQPARMWRANDPRRQRRPIIGTVAEVAHLPVRGSETGVPGLDSDAALYRIVVSLDADQSPGCAGCRAGERVTADIRVSNRPTLDILFGRGAG